MLNLRSPMIFLLIDRATTLRRCTHSKFELFGADHSRRIHYFSLIFFAEVLLSSSELLGLFFSGFSLHFHGVGEEAGAAPLVDPQSFEPTSLFFDG